MFPIITRERDNGQIKAYKRKMDTYPLSEGLARRCLDFGETSPGILMLTLLDEIPLFEIESKNCWETMQSWIAGVDEKLFYLRFYSHTGTDTISINMHISRREERQGVSSENTNILYFLYRGIQEI